ncbi:MAG: RNA exonuclease 3 [Cirrosporium novae-zelandiae]|nr:MAG: RNA exonuclease 3 [Cirrosporium novae-zelandiae]
MFSPTSLFKEVRCPEQEQCHLINCIFSHIIDPPVVLGKNPLSTAEDISNGSSQFDGQPARKKPRLEDARLSRSAGEHEQQCSTAVSKPNTLTIKRASLPPRPINKNGSTTSQSKREISPPPLQTQPDREKATQASKKPISESASQLSAKLTSSKTLHTKKESLNPRLLPRPPASHTIRISILTKLHQQMTRLNDEVVKSHSPDEMGLILSKEDLIVMALDEEEKAAVENPSIYGNVVKLRIVALMKMKVNEWKKSLQEILAQKLPPKDVNPKKQTDSQVVTGLSVDEELWLLPKLLTSLRSLESHGYVNSPPTNTEIASASKGVESSLGFEECDRCKTRFQVFPGRREDGALTSGGKCTYHCARPIRPQKKKMDKSSEQREAYYPCCNESVGQSLGCTTSETHVFKVSEAKRLASILQFERTPEATNKSADQALCFDCEMGYTTYGMELIRLTATKWPTGEEALDVLVRPLGEILDLNSRYSGVWPEQFANAKSHNSLSGGDSQNKTEKSLQIVNSPKAARELLFQHLSPETPLIGHAIENDLNAVRIIHPSVIDTVLLYPHPAKLPYRYGLKMLVKKYLDRDIQTDGGAQGHDSKEDARAAGDLVRYKVGEVWKGLKGKGWKIDKGVFIPPPQNGSRVEAT